MTTSRLALVLFASFYASAHSAPQYDSCPLPVHRCATAVREAADSVRHTVTQPEALADTVAMLAEIWKSANEDYETSYVRWFYLPTQVAISLSVSDGVRSALQRRGIPASDRLPVGDDTLVVRMDQFARHSPDSVRATVSIWRNFILGSGEQRCRAGSGNTYSLTLNRTSLGWTVVKDRLLIAGDNACARIPVDRVSRKLRGNTHHEAALP